MSTTKSRRGRPSPRPASGPCCWSRPAPVASPRGRLERRGVGCQGQLRGHRRRRWSPIPLRSICCPQTSRRPARSRWPPTSTTRPPPSWRRTTRRPSATTWTSPRSGQKLGLEVEVKNVTWDNVIPGIASGRYDFTATNMTPTPERLEVLDMVTYWAPGSSLIVEKGNPLGLSIADESVCGKKIAVMTGSSQQQDYLPLISEDCESAGQEPVERGRPGQRRGRADPAGLQAASTASSPTPRSWPGRPSSRPSPSSCSPRSTRRRWARTPPPWAWRRTRRSPRRCMPRCSR